MRETDLKKHRSELLMPAGSLEKLKLAVLYGADAIYLGTPDMSLRTKSAFTLEDVVEGIGFAHAHGKKVYLTLNLFTHNKDINKLPDFINTIREVKPDGLIIADPGVFQFVKEHAPELEIHISTQANVCSWLSVNYWEKQGASLCVLAREVSYPELVEIRENCPDIKIEAFVHGAMCMTYSGRCLLSNFMSERGANQGNCSNCCRWNYKVHMKLKDGTIKDLEITEDNKDLFDFFIEEEFRPGDLVELQEDMRGSYLLNSKDLCLMPKLDEYLKIGVDSLKVEGRGKSPYYVAVVARAYRRAIDDWYKDPENWSPREYMKELYTVPSRGYTYAFHESRLTNLAHNYEGNTRALAEWEYAGIISEITDDAFMVSVKNRLLAGDVLEFVSPTSKKEVLLRMYEFEDMRKGGEKVEVINAGQDPVIRIPFSLFDHEDIDEIKSIFPVMTVIRKEASMSQEEWARVKRDKTAQNLELGVGSEARYEKQGDDIQKAVDEKLPERRLKTPRLGSDGCCGKGCNGCLVFWNDPTYERARQIMAKKKQGEMLLEKTKDEEAA